MKHNLKVTLILVLLFLFSQLIGLMVTKEYLVKDLPYGIERPDIQKEVSFVYIFIFIIIATIIVLILAKLKLFRIWQIWFFFGVFLTLAISFSAFIHSLIALLLALVIAFVKVLRKSVIIHNLSELFIYGALAAIFVPILNVFSISLLLIIISVYDFIAVRKTKHMVDLAEFQKKSKLFAGLYIPYKKDVAILGGGDIAFPLLFSGVLLSEYGLISFMTPFVISLSLLVLFLISKKKKYYPAMPFLTVGCFVSYLLLLALNLIL